MINLNKIIKKLRAGTISRVVNKRLKEFKELGKKGNKEWFYELCFFLLTANSKASTAINIQKELGFKGFLCNKQKDICSCIKRNKHRFHNNKAKYICEARKFRKIKDILKKEKDPRKWLVDNIKGLGWKESSHFLRNVGFTRYAILDRHIINLLFDIGKIDKKPKTLTKKEYLRIEKVFNKISLGLGMNSAELDLYMWYIKTGKVLK